MVYGRQNNRCGWRQLLSGQRDRESHAEHVTTSQLARSYDISELARSLNSLINRDNLVLTLEIQILPCNESYRVKKVDLSGVEPVDPRVFLDGELQFQVVRARLNPYEY